MMLEECCRKYHLLALENRQGTEEYQLGLLEKLRLRHYRTDHL